MSDSDSGVDGGADGSVDGGVDGAVPDGGRDDAGTQQPTLAFIPSDGGEYLSAGVCELVTLVSTEFAVGTQVSFVPRDRDVGVYKAGNCSIEEAGVLFVGSKLSVSSGLVGEALLTLTPADGGARAVPLSFFGRLNLSRALSPQVGCERFLVRLTARADPRISVDLRTPAALTTSSSCRFGTAFSDGGAGTAWGAGDFVVNLGPPSPYVAAADVATTTGAKYAGCKGIPSNCISGSCSAGLCSCIEPGGSCGYSMSGAWQNEPRACCSLRADASVCD